MLLYYRFFDGNYNRIQQYHIAYICFFWTRFLECDRKLRIGLVQHQHSVRLRRLTTLPSSFYYSGTANGRSESKLQ